MLKQIKIGVFLMINLILAVLLGLLLLCGVFTLPVEKIDQNVRKSAPIIQEEGTYPDLSTSFTSTLDNFTDSIMLLEAADDRDASILLRAVSAYRGGMNYTDNPANVLVGHYVGGFDFNTTLPYFRYWHGYLVFLKPLLLITDYHGVRIVNGILQASLFIITALLFLERKKDLYVIPWMLGYLMLMPIVLAKCLQYSSCFYVFMFGALALLLVNDIQKYAPFIFLNVGIATAFFDFLTYPIATFGVPMAVYLVLTENRYENLSKRIIAIIKNGVIWVIGYVGMWASKWIVTSYIINYNVVKEAFDTFLYRSGDTQSGIHLSRGPVVLGNYATFLQTPVIYVTIICLIYLIYMIVKNRWSHTWIAWKNFIPYFLVGLAPIAWYCFALNHSAVHVFFVNKACIVTYLAILFGLLSVAETKTVEIEETGTVMDGEAIDGQNSSNDSVLFTK